MTGEKQGMGLEKAIEKLDKYQRRLTEGRAAKIKPSHLKQVAEKLLAKEQALRAELDEATKDDKRERIERKLALVREQQTRAKWLAEQLGL